MTKSEDSESTSDRYHQRMALFRDSGEVSSYTEPVGSLNVNNVGLCQRTVVEAADGRGRQEHCLGT